MAEPPDQFRFSVPEIAGFKTEIPEFRMVPNPVVEAARKASKDASITHSLLRGDSLFEALKQSVDKLKASAPEEHDVLVQAFGVNITEIGFVEPHAFLLRGYDHEGNNTFVVAHFSQLVTHVVFFPKRGPERVITGFWRAPVDPGEASPPKG